MDTPTKPAVSNIWAHSAGSADLLNPGQTFIEAGWPLSTTPPARQYFNWLLNYCFNGVRYQSYRGVADWDAAETYAAACVTLGSDGLLYRALVGSSNVSPANGANLGTWAPLATFTSTGVNQYDVANVTYVGNQITALNNSLTTAINNEVSARQTAVAGEASTRASGDANTLATAESYTNAQVAPLAPKNSPNFTGVPTAPTAAPGTSNSQLATTAFAAGTTSIGANGYTQLPSGLILQWGIFNGPNGGASPQAMSFPITFPNACLSMTISTKRAATGAVGTNFVDNLSQTPGTTLSPNGAYVTCDRDDAGGPLRGFWMAIGY